jgi:hypothetical protein
MEGVLQKLKYICTKFSLVFRLKFEKYLSSAHMFSFCSIALLNLDKVLPIENHTHSSMHKLILALIGI